MKPINKIIPAVAFILLAGGALGVSQAQAYGCPHMSGHGGHYEKNVNITDEQRQQARALVEKAQESMGVLKQQLFIKHEELRALQNAATPDVSAVSKKATEITQLQNKLTDERKALGVAIDKALGLEPGTHGFGHKGNAMGEHKM